MHAQRTATPVAPSQDLSVLDDLEESDRRVECTGNEGSNFDLWQVVLVQRRVVQGGSGRGRGCPGRTARAYELGHRPHVMTAHPYAGRPAGTAALR